MRVEVLPAAEEVRLLVLGFRTPERADVRRRRLRAARGALPALEALRLSGEERGAGDGDPWLLLEDLAATIGGPCAPGTGA